MRLTLLENAQELRKRFIKNYTLSWETFQIEYKDWIAQTAKRPNPFGKECFYMLYLWDRISPLYPRVSFAEALKVIRKITGNVLIMSEDETHPYPEKLFYNGQKITNFVAEVDAKALAKQIADEWFGSYELEAQNMYNPNPVCRRIYMYLTHPWTGLLYLPMKPPIGMQKSTIR